MCADNKAEKLIEFIKDNYDEEDLSIFWTGITMLQKHTKLKDVGKDYLNELNLIYHLYVFGAPAKALKFKYPMKLLSIGILNNCMDLEFLIKYKNIKRIFFKFDRRF